MPPQSTDATSLRSAAWLLSGLSVWSLSVADFVSQRDRKIESLADEDALELGLFIVGACALVWAAPLAQLGGARLKSGEGFRLVQFLSGGLPSVMMQAFGWSCYATAVFGALVSLLNPGMRLRGLKTGLAILGLAGQALVNVSVDLYESDGGTEVVESADELGTPFMPPVFPKNVSRFNLVVSLFALVLSCAGFCLTLLCEAGFFFAESYPVIWNVSFGLFAASIAILNTTTRRNGNSAGQSSSSFGRSSSDISFSRSSFDLITEDEEDEVERVAEWFSFLLLFCAFWILLRLNATPAFASLTGSTISLGIVGLIASLLAMYAKFSQVEALPSTSGHNAAVAAVVLPASPRPSSPRVTGETNKSEKRTIPISIASSAATPIPKPHTSFVYKLSVVIFVFALVARVLGSSNSVASALFMVGAPMAQIGTWLALRFDEGFMLARTGLVRGGMEFTVFQGVGWMAYGFTLLGTLAFAQATDVDMQSWGHPNWDDLGGVLLPIAVIAHGSLLWSKQVFKRLGSSVHVQQHQASSSPDKASTSLNLDQSMPPSTTAALPPTVDVQLPTAAVASPPTTPPKPSIKSKNPDRATTLEWGSSGILAWISVLSSPTSPLISAVTSAISALLLVIQSPKPYKGGAPFIVQQALGWTIYVTSVVIHLALFVNVHDFRDKYLEYDIAICAVRSMGLIVLHTSRKSFTAGETGDLSPRRNRRVEEEFALDLREIDDLIENARRSNVKKVLKESKLKLIAHKSSMRFKSIGWGVAAVIVAHVTLLMGVYVEWMRRHEEDSTWATAFFAASAGGSFMNAFLIHVVLGKSLWGNQRYSVYQPFRGGVQYVVLQLLGWPLTIVPVIAELVCFNYGLGRVVDGLVAGLALVSFAGQILLLASISKFDAEAAHLGFAFSNDDVVGGDGVQMDRTKTGGIGWTLSAVALCLFLGVDVAIVRFGLQDTSLLVPVIMCGWIAVALSVPLAYFLEDRAYRRERGSSASSIEGAGPPPGKKIDLLRVFGLALWTFSLLLGLLLIGRAATLSSALWLPSKTGLVGVLAHGVVSLSTDPTKGFPFAQQALAILLTFGFVWIVIPAMRWLLDGPMWYWAYFFKFWTHSLSPDGRHPLESAEIFRNVSFGENVMDVLIPSTNGDGGAANRTSGESASTDGAKAKNSGKEAIVIEDEEEAHPPIVWLHGGGHLFVQRELLIHSTTPFCRVGLVVYATEYPLAPEAKFPKAIVCVLQAMTWIKKNHCRSGRCLVGGKPRICEECRNAGIVPNIADTPGYACGCCSHCRGASTVQLLGDSAGGNLAGMVAALLTNDHLLSALAPHSGYANFLQWRFPKVQRLGLLYGLLGRDLDFGRDESLEESWTTWVVRKSGSAAVTFLLHQYAGGDENPALRGRVVLNDLEGDLLDFAPETLMLCGLADPLVATNRQALKIIRERTGRECRLVEYPGAVHGFVGFPPQWTLGRWKKDALPATAELVAFFTGGKRSIDETAIALAVLPRDFSPLVVLPCTFLFVLTVLFAAFKTVVWAALLATGLTMREE